MKRNVAASFLLLFLLSSLSGDTQVQRDQPSPVPVSFVQILSNPEKFDGKEINVVGFLSISFEKDVLFFRPEDHYNGILENGVWVEPHQVVTKDPENNLNYVRVVGTFHATRKPYYQLAGQITDVRYCTFWSDPKKPEASRRHPTAAQEPK